MKPTFLFIAVYVFISCANVPPIDMQNPLPDCPTSPNCAKESFQFTVLPDLLKRSTETSLSSVGASSVVKTDGGFDAVFTIPVFGWKDDVQVVFEIVADSTTALHIRSSSREGYYDLGVNKRRVRKILRSVKRELNSL